MADIDKLLDYILTRAHDYAIELDDADLKARVETWRRIQAGELNLGDFDDDSMEYDAACAYDARKGTVGMVTTEVAYASELKAQNAALIKATQATEQLCMSGPFDSGADLETARLRVLGLCACALELAGVAQNDAPAEEGA